MTITSKKGDRGTTYLISGEEVGKDSLRIELLGTIDELSCQLGNARSVSDDPEISSAVLTVQRELIEVAAAIADPAGASSQSTDIIFAKRVAEYEKRIAQIEQSTPPVTEFRLPGACRLEALLHLARSVARRCERQAVRLQKYERGLTVTALVFFNRLADYLWLLARRAELEAEK